MMSGGRKVNEGAVVYILIIYIIRCSWDQEYSFAWPLAGLVHIFAGTVHLSSIFYHKCLAGLKLVHNMTPASHIIHMIMHYNWLSNV